MAHPSIHAKSSAQKYGGQWQDYLAIHEFFDQTKAFCADARHRMILHNSFGIFLCEQMFGSTIINSDGKDVPVRLIAEQHVQEDFGGFIPTLNYVIDHINYEPWMARNAVKLSKLLEQDQDDDHMVDARTESLLGGEARE